MMLVDVVLGLVVVSATVVSALAVVSGIMPLVLVNVVLGLVVVSVTVVTVLAVVSGIVPSILVDVVADVLVLLAVLVLVDVAVVVVSLESLVHAGFSTGPQWQRDLLALHESGSTNVPLSQNASFSPP